MPENTAYFRIDGVDHTVTEVSLISADGTFTLLSAADVVELYEGAGKVCYQDRLYADWHRMRTAQQQQEADCAPTESA